MTLSVLRMSLRDVESKSLMLFAVEGLKGQCARRVRAGQFYIQKPLKP